MADLEDRNIRRRQVEMEKEGERERAGERPNGERLDRNGRE